MYKIYLFYGELIVKKERTIRLAQRAGLNLKRLIKESKWKTQERFAIAMNAHPTTIRRWIAHGINDINNIERIAEILEINFIELLK